MRNNIIQTGYRKKHAKVWKEFKLNVKINDETIYIKHKNTVCYLGTNLDERLKFIKHVEMTIEKCKKTFFSYKSLFHSLRLNERVKILCYTLFIRPIVIYACQVWFNLSPSTMEKVRVFERACRRACLGMYRTQNSNFKRFFSNLEVYEKANIPRIDNFIIKLTRDHSAKAARNNENANIFSHFNIEDTKIEETLKSGYVPPHAFPYLDKHNFIQNNSNIPIIYHIHRHALNKRIALNAINYDDDPTTLSRFSTALPLRDKNCKLRFNNKK